MSGMRGPYSTPRTWYTPVDPGPPSVGSVSCPRLGEESVSLCDRNIARSRCAMANSSSDGNPCNERREADPNGRLPCVKDLCSTPHPARCTVSVHTCGARSVCSVPAGAFHAVVSTRLGQGHLWSSPVSQIVWQPWCRHGRALSRHCCERVCACACVRLCASVCLCAWLRVCAYVHTRTLLLAYCDAGCCVGVVLLASAC